MNSKQNVLSYGRFKGLAWFDLISQSLIFVGGAGGIGSHLAFQLARTGARLLIADNDTVGEENLAGQLYGKQDIGKKKTEAIIDVIVRLCSEDNVTPLDTLITEEDAAWRHLIPRCDVVCVGFDNLKARELVYKAWRTTGKRTSLFIDGRLAAESGQVYFLDKNSTEEQFTAYEQTYFPESERVELPCTMKATTHCGALIASLMVSNITNWFNNQVKDSLPRDLAHYDFQLPLTIIEPIQLKVKEHDTVQLV